MATLDLLRFLGRRRGFFQHASVGAELCGSYDPTSGGFGATFGLKELVADNAGSGFTVATNQTTAAGIPAGSMGEIQFSGLNGNPAGKLSSFDATVRAGLGGVLDYCMVKLGYPDFTGGNAAGTGQSATAWFNAVYAPTMDALIAAYPSTKFLHCTVPLYQASSWWDNPTIETFNALMRARYPATTFDLAWYESHDPATGAASTANGSWCQRAAYANGDNHLNLAGTTDIALKLLTWLASVLVHGTAIVPADRRTTWANAGILLPAGGDSPSGYEGFFTFDEYLALTSWGTGPVTNLLASTYGNGTTDATAAINAALAALGTWGTVRLSAGLWRINGTIQHTKNGTRLMGVGQNTRLRFYGANADAIVMGAGVNWGAAVNVGGAGGVGTDIIKGTRSFTAPAGSFAIGDMVVIDMLDDSDVTLGGNPAVASSSWWKRNQFNADNGPVSSGGWRSRGQMVEIVYVSGTTYSIAGYFHRSFPASLSPQAFTSTANRAGTEVGLQDMSITGWGTGVYGVRANWLKKSWIYRVEFDGEVSGADDGTPAAKVGTNGCDVRLFRCYGCEIRRNYLHHSRSYITNNHAYSVSLAMQSSDNLVIDNIIFRKDKNETHEASGSGNVVIYNYADDPVLSQDGGASQDGTSISQTWMEQCLDGSHLSHPMFDLYEGNYCAKMGAADTHGSASDQTFFRNWAKGDRPYPLTGGIVNMMGATMFGAGMRRMNVVANVLATRASPTPIYEPAATSGAYAYSDLLRGHIFWNGCNDGSWQSPVDAQVAATMLRQRNWDSVRAALDAGLEPNLETPPSLIYGVRPKWWPAGMAWPPVEPGGASAQARAPGLPAYSRFLAGTPFVDPPVAAVQASMSGYVRASSSTQATMTGVVAAAASFTSATMTGTVAQQEGTLVVNGPLPETSVIFPISCVGSADPLAQVTVINEDTGEVIGTATADAAGGWLVNLPTA